MVLIIRINNVTPYNLLPRSAGLCDGVTQTGSEEQLHTGWLSSEVILVGKFIPKILHPVEVMKAPWANTDLFPLLTFLLG